MIMPNENDNAKLTYDYVKVCISHQFSRWKWTHERSEINGIYTRCSSWVVHENHDAEKNEKCNYNEKCNEHYPICQSFIIALSDSVVA